MSELASPCSPPKRRAPGRDAARPRAFDAFRRAFDEPAYRRGLAARRPALGRAAASQVPASARSIHDPPPGLFVRGAPSRRLSATTHGRDRRRPRVLGLRRDGRPRLARELAAAGAVIVSGLARGVDAAAHRGALEAGATVAVLGCGIDRDYPRAHAALAAEIAARGSIVSEYAPGVEPAPWRFPGPQPDHRGSRRRDGRGRGARAERSVDHRRPCARGRPRGARCAGRDHERRSRRARTTCFVSARRRSRASATCWQCSASIRRRPHRR